MPELFRRAWAIQVGTIRVSGEGAGGGGERASLDCSFEIEKSTRREPNTAAVKVWNLSQEHRAALRQTRNVALRVEAGYVGHVSTLFDGDVRVAQSAPGVERRRKADKTRLRSIKDATDWVTEIEAEDGGTAYRTATVQQSFGRNTPVATVLRAAVTAMGIGEGNLRELGADPELAGSVGVYENGTVLSGVAHRELDRIVRSVGLRWSVQNGVLQLKRGRQALATRAVMLNKETGLIGSPTLDADGFVEATSLLNGALYPGRPVVLESRELSGSFQVRRVRHVGDTSVSDWYSETILEAR